MKAPRRQRARSAKRSEESATFANRLRETRLARGLSQRDLAQPGVSYAYISRLEAGARRPSIRVVRLLAAKLGVSADWLETGQEPRRWERFREEELRELTAALRQRSDSALKSSLLGELEGERRARR